MLQKSFMDMILVLCYTVPLSLIREDSACTQMCTHTHTHTYTPSGTSGSVWRHFWLYKWGEAREAAKPTAIHRMTSPLPSPTSSPTKNYPTQNVNTAEVEKPPHPEKEHPRQRTASKQGTKPENRNTVDVPKPACVDSHCLSPAAELRSCDTAQGAGKARNTYCLGLERRHLPNSTWTEQHDRLVWLWPSKQRGAVRGEIRVEAGGRLQRHLRPTEVAGILKAFCSALSTSAAPSYSWLLSIWSVAWAAVTRNFTFPFS